MKLLEAVKTAYGTDGTDGTNVRRPSWTAGHYMNYDDAQPTEPVRKWTGSDTRYKAPSVDANATDWETV